MFVNLPFFSQVLKLQVILDNMLSHKLAALFALMVFASHGVIGRPYPDGPGPEDTVDNLLGDIGIGAGEIGVQTLPAAVIVPGLEAANQAEQGK